MTIRDYTLQKLYGIILLLTLYGCGSAPLQQASGVKTQEKVQEKVQERVQSLSPQVVAQLREAEIFSLLTAQKWVMFFVIYMESFVSCMKVGK